jgi:hypothetical protein
VAGQGFGQGGGRQAACPPAAPVMARAVWRANRKDLERLKALLEA